MQALDGGYLALLVAEAVRGKKLPQGVEQGIMAIRLPAHHWCWAAACVPGRPEPSAWQLAHVKWMHIEALQSVVD